MNVHQVLTGALNDGNFSFSVGCIDGHKFIACAVGANVVILTSNFTRIQVIHGTQCDVVRSVNCCNDSGKIAIAHDKEVRIFEPVSSAGGKFYTFPYTWQEAHSIHTQLRVDYLEWVLEGLRLLVLSECTLVFYQHKLLTSAVSSKGNESYGVVFNIDSDNKNIQHSESFWETVWTTELSSKPKYVKFSPDSTLFATCGENDRFVKIWYPNESNTKNGVYDFSFIYLQHPDVVFGFEWRHTGKYVPRKCVNNAIITWCADNTSRIWKQTPSINDTVEQLLNAVQVVQQDRNVTRKSPSKHATLKKARTRLMSKINKLMNDKNSSTANPRTKSINFGRSATFADFSVPAASHNVSFSLATTINAENDCFLVPSIDERNSSMSCAFAVHWLNNKEFFFTYGAEKILADTLFNDHSDGGQRSGATSTELGSPIGGSTDGNAGTALDTLTPTAENTASNYSTGGESIKDLVDVKIEGLVQQWNRTSDILFSVHPVDGSLLTWTIEWLDDDWRQAVVSFASRFPNAFPLTDASSLNLSIAVFSPHETTLGDFQRHFGEHADEQESTHVGNFIHMLTSHDNGSLNLWQLCLEENRQYNNILNIVHRYRMCGHRFRTSGIAAHPILPLLLTTSSFSSANTGPTSTTGESELILWKINPVGSLCKSGGVRELSRITSKSAAVFKCISWIPTIIPSSSLGTVCNSPSSCFITTKDGCLSVYQAIVDARMLLSELFTGNSQRDYSSSLSTQSEDEESDPKNDQQKKHPIRLNEMFNISSTQSTGKPGCIIHLTRMVDSELGTGEILLMHTFDEALALSDYEQPSLSPLESQTGSTGKFFTLLVQRSPDGQSTLIKMWSVKICTQTPTAINDREVSGPFKARSFSLAGPQFYATALPTVPNSKTNNHFNVEPNQTAACLLVETKKIYEAPIDFLPDDIQIRSVTVSAGHLPSSSVYPACRTPYFLLVTCSDNTVRFLRCVRDQSKLPTEVYVWECWRMIGDGADPSLDIAGKICSIASANSSRFACAFLSEATINKDVASFVRNLNVSLYECESSGGVEWLQEERLRLDRCFPDREYINSVLCHSVDKTTLSKLSSLVRLDWASTEDGTHILTVGVANLVFFFAQMSQNVAQQNVTIMTEEQQTRRPTLRRDSSIAASLANPLRSLTRWVCIRYVDLESVDGLAPIPSVLSWVRDGLLVIGMPSEMRVYNQWNLKPVKETPKAEVPHKSVVQKTIKVMGIRPVASASNLSASRSQLMLDQVLKLSTGKSPLDIKLDHKSEAKPDHGHTENVATPEDAILKSVVEEGIFEASRLANPILPQYHPQVLIKMLNSGKTKRVKAILLHVLRALKQQQVTMKNPLSRAASVRRFNSSFATEDTNLQESSASLGISKQRSVIEDDELEYQELDGIPPLPLHALMSVDNVISGNEKAANIDGPKKELYESLFKEGESDEDLDDVLDDLQRGDTYSRSSRSRHSSTSSEVQTIPSAFTSRHNQMLSDLLGYIHLPGLSSVDQMHLLAIAATLSHFSSDVMDKLTQANASFQQNQPTNLIDTSASGYAASGGLGIETVDECGLRFLMAMKQHEYLLKHMPKQRQRLRARGMSTSQIVWAFHSDAETELLNALPCCQKGEENWEDLRAYGVAWWVRNTTTLRLCIEKVAKAAFQQNQEPMDAALYYLALRKKNVLAHLFKTVNDHKKNEFFREDFDNERWKKAAQKNAFILMSLQKFHYSAAFFLLAGSLKDAVQTILTRLKDLQLAMVVIRLYELDREKQIALMEEMLCEQVLGTTPAELREISKEAQNNASISLPRASRDPFIRSMALWLSQEYAMSAFTLVEEASCENAVTHAGVSDASLADIFNFYTFLRRNPLVMRQRLTNCGIQVASTEKFLSYARDLENRVTPYERRLYFRTAAAHMASGCPLLALDVISMLPRRMCSTVPTDLKVEDDVFAEKPLAEEKVDNVDWSAPTNVVKDDELNLNWSDDDKSEEEKEEPKSSFNESVSAPKFEGLMPTLQDAEESTAETTESIDFIAQHMKFVAALKMMTDELATLASGVEVDGGQLRIELLDWLEKECTTLKDICEYRSDEVTFVDNHPDSTEEQSDLFSSLKRRRCWVLANQKLIRTFTSYCILHSAQNHRLTSVLMELILLLLEVQQETNGVQDDATLQTKTFPLFVASISSCRMFVSSPLNFIEDQCTDLLLTIAQFNQPPPFGTPILLIKKVYNLCQGLSSCLYQSLSCLDDVGRNDRDMKGVLTSRLRAHSFSHDDMAAKSNPASWPGVDSLIALLSLGRDEEAPNLRLVLVKSFFSVAVALFSYALAVYDPRWLYRLSARDVNSIAYSQIFGGAGERNIHKVKPPNRPPPPSAKPVQPSVAAANTVRANLHAKVFGADELKSQQIEQTVSCWVPPKKHIVQFFAEKIEPNRHAANEVVFDSDAESDSSDEEELDEFDRQTRPHKDPNSYAWLLIRFACVVHQLDNLKRFLSVAGFELSELVSLSPHIDNVVKLLNTWSVQLQNQIENYPDGCPVAFLRNMHFGTESAASTTTARPSTPPLLRKYQSLVEANNTPFEYSSHGVLPVKRLWSFLVRQENTSHYFIRHIFAKDPMAETKDPVVTVATKSTSSQSTNEQAYEPIKIVQREREGILSFACNNIRPGWIVVSTSREIQEINIERLIEDKENVHGLRSSSNFLNNRVDLDIALEQASRDKLRDNDDYQIISNRAKTQERASFLQKRHLSGVRRLESHPTLPYYVSGATDGSILLWEWNVDQPIFTARVASQFAKVTKLAFAMNGNKFASVDGDGHLCIWQATQQMATRKPFFNQKCHSKSATDVKFLGQTSSVLVTAGQSQGDNMNISLWDTLLPQNRSMVYSFNGHVDGATCVTYFPNTQTIVSGGRHGEICMWDLRQRQLRSTVKAYDSAAVRSMFANPASNILVTGSSEGDIKIWDTSVVPQLLHTLPNEHSARGGFSLRPVGSSSSLQGVQQIYYDSEMRLFSCGADYSLKIRNLPTY